MKFMPWQYPTAGLCRAYATSTLRRESRPMPSRSGCPGKVRGRSLSICLRTRRKDCGSGIGSSSTQPSTRDAMTDSTDSRSSSRASSGTSVSGSSSPASMRSRRKRPSRRRSSTRAKICQHFPRNAIGTPPATKALSSRSSSGIVLEVSAPATRHPSAPLTALASRTRTTASSVRLPKASPEVETDAPEAEFPFVLTSPEIDDASATSSLLCDRKASHRSARSVSSVTYIGALRLYASTCSGLTTKP
mmetsp:Transcript_3067/g.13797  ORF Transcript_3067/g.13797 Transcript_3067/m.13797 type:complete len:247 (-) Transcript_3067:108-848(-)